MYLCSIYFGLKVPTKWNLFNVYLYTAKVQGALYPKPLCFLYGNLLVTLLETLLGTRSVRVLGFSLVRALLEAQRVAK